MQVRDVRDFFNYFIILRNIQQYFIGGKVRKRGKMALSRTGSFLRVFFRVFCRSFLGFFEPDPAKLEDGRMREPGFQ